MDMSKVIVLDTETTGLTPDDEILQLSIIDGNGKTHLNRLFKPAHHDSWEIAMTVNHMTPEMVQSQGTLKESSDEINQILKDCKTIVGYNVAFDLRMLFNNGISIPVKTIHDVMEKFAHVMGVRKPNGQFKFFKLTECAQFYGFNPKEMNFHDSLTDVIATLHCYKAIGADNFN